MAVATDGERDGGEAAAGENEIAGALLIGSLVTGSFAGSDAAVAAGGEAPILAESLARRSGTGDTRAI